MTNKSIAWNLVVTLPCVWFLFKETKGLSLEEIDLMFGGRALGALPSDLDEKKEEAEAVVAMSEGTHKVA
jgi:hypothetical protein